MDVSVIIATHNEREVLRMCLQSLLSQDYPRDRYEVIVVDDGSSDETDEMVSKVFGNNENLRYIRLLERCGQSRARNEGLLHAKGEIVIFLDSDSICPRNFLSEHVRYHRRWNKVIIDGPAINTKDTKITFLKRALAFLDRGGAVFLTCNTSCKRGDLIEGGLFDEGFGTRYGWMDREFGRRLIKRGLRRKKAVSAFVLHFKYNVKLEEIYNKMRDRGENAVLYYKKHPSLKTKMEARLYLKTLDKVINVFSWMDRKVGKWILSKRLLRRLNIIHHYAKGLRAGIEKYLR
jgi:glycosyltransferase involved in cell wall biosynthesis